MASEFENELKPLRIEIFGPFIHIWLEHGSQEHSRIQTIFRRLTYFIEKHQNRIIFMVS